MIRVTVLLSKIHSSYFCASLSDLDFEGHSDNKIQMKVVCPGKFWSDVIQCLYSCYIYTICLSDIMFVYIIIKGNMWHVRMWPSLPTTINETLKWLTTFILMQNHSDGDSVRVGVAFLIPNSLGYLSNPPVPCLRPLGLKHPQSFSQHTHINFVC